MIITLIGGGHLCAHTVQSEAWGPSTGSDHLFGTLDHFGGGGVVMGQAQRRCEFFADGGTRASSLLVTDTTA